MNVTQGSGGPQNECVTQGSDGPNDISMDVGVKKIWVDVGE